MMKLIAALCMLQLAAGFSVQPQAALQLRTVRPALSRPLPPIMQEEEAPPPAPVEAAAPEPPPPPPAEPEREFDITNYSITITLAVVFVLAKAAGYFGLIN